MDGAAGGGDMPGAMYSQMMGAQEVDAGREPLDLRKEGTGFVHLFDCTGDMWPLSPEVSLLQCILRGGSHGAGPPVDIAGWTFALIELN